MTRDLSATEKPEMKILTVEMKSKTLHSMFVALKNYNWGQVNEKNINEIGWLNWLGYYVAALCINILSPVSNNLVLEFDHDVI